MSRTWVDQVIQMKSRAIRKVGMMNTTHERGLARSQLRSLQSHSSVCRCSYSRQFCGVRGKGKGVGETRSAGNTAYCWHFTHGAKTTQQRCTLRQPYLEIRKATP